MRVDVETLAEGLGGLREEMDRGFASVKREFDETRSLIKLSYARLDRRIGTPP